MPISHKIEGSKNVKTDALVYENSIKSSKKNYLKGYQIRIWEYY